MSKLFKIGMSMLVGLLIVIILLGTVSTWVEYGAFSGMMFIGLFIYITIAIILCIRGRTK